MIQEEPKVISGLFRALAFLMLQKDIIGSDVFKPVLSMIIDFISQGLTHNYHSFSKN